MFCHSAAKLIPRGVKDRTRQRQSPSKHFIKNRVLLQEEYIQIFLEKASQNLFFIMLNAFVFFSKLGGENSVSEERINTEKRLVF